MKENNELRLDFQIRITCGWRAEAGDGPARAGEAHRSVGGARGARDASHIYSEQTFLWRALPEIFLKAAFSFFFLKAAFQMVLNAGPNDMATRTSGRIKLPSFGAGH